MRVVLEVIAGTRTGLRTTLHAGQSVSVGRSDWADFVCSWDEAMSREHFRLEIDAVACKLTDLNSRNGTRVNDQPVTSVLLRDGDEIQTGDTTFRVHIEGDSPDLALQVHGTGIRRGPSRLDHPAGTGGRTDGRLPASSAPLRASRIYDFE
jgi:pSer/pThr/pTyr-binding forkhead associated (FHA) protein